MLSFFFEELIFNLLVQINCFQIKRVNYTIKCVWFFSLRIQYTFSQFAYLLELRHNYIFKGYQSDSITSHEINSISFTPIKKGSLNTNNVKKINLYLFIHWSKQNVLYFLKTHYIIVLLDYMNTPFNDMFSL